MEGVIYPLGGGDLPHQNTSPRAPVGAKNFECTVDICIIISFFSLKNLFLTRVLFRTLKLIKYVEPWQRVSQSIVGYRGQWRCKHCCSRNSALGRPDPIPIRHPPLPADSHPSLIFRRLEDQTLNSLHGPSPSHDPSFVFLPHFCNNSVVLLFSPLSFNLDSCLGVSGISSPMSRKVFASTKIRNL